MNLDFVEKVAAANVCLTIANIKHRSEILHEMEGNNEIAIVGGMYEIQTGNIEFFIKNKFYQPDELLSLDVFI